MAQARIITSMRLELIPATLAMLRADRDRSPQLAALLGAVVPTEWPSEDYAEALPVFVQEMELRPEVAGWWVYYWVRKAAEGAPRVLVGGGGFRGCPSDDGLVELGYGIIPEYQGLGYATEAAFALIAFAFGHPRVEAVFADTLGDNMPSRHVLEKLGFRLVGEGAEPGTVRYDLPRALFAARAKVY